MKDKKIVVIVLALLVTALSTLVWIRFRRQPSPVTTTLKGYVDSAGRRAWQFVMTAYVDGECYVADLFYVGEENKGLDPDDPQVVVLVTAGGQYISEDALDQEVEIVGVKREGQLCHPSVSKVEEYLRKGMLITKGMVDTRQCRKKTVVIVNEVVDQHGSSLLINSGESLDSNEWCR